MAEAKYKNLIGQATGSEFDVTHGPGSNTPFSGIYRCKGCAMTVVGERDRKMPPQNHHQHSPAQGAIAWQLLVRSSHTHPTI